MKNFLLLFSVLVVVFIALLPSAKFNLPVTTTPTPVVLGTQIGTRTKTTGCQYRNSLPDSACTPGAVLNAAVKDICTPGYTKNVRNVSTSLKDQVYSQYGILTHTVGEYEVDHLIPLELGGSNDIANLWPEPANPTPGFHQKDQVENYLHDQVCNHGFSLSTAQQIIATDWLQVLPIISPITSNLTPPISQYQSRLNLRWFGKNVTSQDKNLISCGAAFTGFHTGDDLEAFPTEANTDVPIVSIAQGKVISISHISGYGGLIVVSSIIHDQPVTVYYGHINLQSAAVRPGQEVTSGQFLANLGQGCSSQTDGERKHLHFAIHQGTQVDVHGYVPTPEALSFWFDPSQVLFSK